MKSNLALKEELSFFRNKRISSIDFLKGESFNELQASLAAFLSNENLFSFFPKERFYYFLINFDFYNFLDHSESINKSILKNIINIFQMNSFDNFTFQSICEENESLLFFTLVNIEFKSESSKSFKRFFFNNKTYFLNKDIHFLAKSKNYCNKIKYYEDVLKTKIFLLNQDNIKKKINTNLISFKKPFWDKNLWKPNEDKKIKNHPYLKISINKKDFNDIKMVMNYNKSDFYFNDVKRTSENLFKFSLVLQVKGIDKGLENFRVSFKIKKDDNELFFWQETNVREMSLNTLISVKDHTEFTKYSFHANYFHNDKNIELPILWDLR